MCPVARHSLRPGNCPHLFRARRDRRPHGKNVRPALAEPLGLGRHCGRPGGPRAKPAGRMSPAATELPQGENLRRAEHWHAGALAMGMVVGMVAAPCVGPVTVGLLVYVSTTGDPWLGFWLFFALALGLA